MAIDLSARIGKLRLKNPVMAASGTFGYAEEFAHFLDLRQLGAIVTKTITLRPRQGNKPPRTCETPAGMLNSIGLENPGLEAFIAEKMPYVAALRVPLIVSLASEQDPAEFVTLARRLDKERAVSALELNISCPNVRHSAKGLKAALIAQDPRATYETVKAVRKVTGKTLITKLSPNVTDITEIALAAQKAGSDALALVNTITGMSVDIRSRRPKLAMTVGGLSGPAIRPIAVRMVWEVFRKVRIPIIGMGGIADAASALEFIIAGATAVSVGTQNFVQPAVCAEVIRGIRSYLTENRLRAIAALRGTLCP